MIFFQSFDPWEGSINYGIEGKMSRHLSNTAAANYFPSVIYQHKSYNVMTDCPTVKLLPLTKSSLLEITHKI